MYIYTCVCTPRLHTLQHITVRSGIRLNDTELHVLVCLFSLHKAVLILRISLLLFGLRNKDRHAGGNITGCSSEPGSDLLKADKLTEILRSLKLAQNTSRWRQGMHALCI